MFAKTFPFCHPPAASESQSTPVRVEISQSGTERPIDPNGSVINFTHCIRCVSGDRNAKAAMPPPPPRLMNVSWFFVLESTPCTDSISHQCHFHFHTLCMAACSRTALLQTPFTGSLGSSVPDTVVNMHSEHSY